MSILNIFNSISSITISDLLKQLGMTNSGLIFIKNDIIQLISLGILQKYKKEHDLLDNISSIDIDIGLHDKLSVNLNFKSNSSKIVLQAKNFFDVKIKRSLSEEISHFVLEDRKYQIDSVIMKILKTHKKLSLDSIKELVTKSLRSYFVP
jgi:hypothetical protein